MNTVPIHQPASKLLVIDDDEGVSDLIEKISRELKFSVNCIHDYESIGSTFKSFKPDIIFLDLMLPGYDGIEVLHYFAEEGCKAKIILISGVDNSTLSSAGEVGRMNRLNIVGTLKKPFSVEDIEKALLEEADNSCRFTSEAFQSLLGPGEFRILCQPCMAIKTLAGEGMSDLDISVQWFRRSGQYSMLPNQYMPKLLESNMVSEFNHAVIEMSFAIFKTWIDKGLDFGLVIKLDDEMYSDANLPSYVLNLSRKLLIPPQKLTLGVSEATVLSDSPQVLDVLTRFRINGFNISAEISNTETTELERLLHLPINELRLVKELIRTVPGNVDAEFNISTLISTCDKQGIATRAEGIETGATMEFLYKCGCAYGLGDYFSEPLKFYELESFILQGEALEGMPALELVQ